MTAFQHEVTRMNTSQVDPLSRDVITEADEKSMFRPLHHLQANTAILSGYFCTEAKGTGSYGLVYMGSAQGVRYLRDGLLPNISR